MQLQECPAHLYRVSKDIAPQFYSTMYNLQHTTMYQDVKHPMSRPGCWAYPDMLQVGNNMNTAESQTHFAAWCITSAPLVLGFDLTNTSLLSSIYDIIANHALSPSTRPGRGTRGGWWPTPPRRSSGSRRTVRGGRLSSAVPRGGARTSHTQSRRSGRSH